MEEYQSVQKYLKEEINLESYKGKDWLITSKMLNFTHN